MWNRPPPSGFRGLDPNKPLRVYYRHLPHWRQDGASYFFTFRLGDSLPQDKLRELRWLRAEWEREYPAPRSRQAWEAHARLVMEKVECWLDQGVGACVLRNASAARFVVQGLHHFDGTRYELGCYVIMPNHVHGVVRPLAPDRQPLEKILQSWKRFSSREIQKTLGETGSLWQEESFDRIIRDEEHLYRVIQYIGANPKRARLRHEESIRWARPAWAEEGWGFEDSP